MDNQVEEFETNLKEKLIKHRELQNEIRQKRNEISELYKCIEEYKNSCPNNAHILKNRFRCPSCGRFI